MNNSVKVKVKNIRICLNCGYTDIKNIFKDAYAETKIRCPECKSEAIVNFDMEVFKITSGK